LADADDTLVLSDGRHFKMTPTANREITMPSTGAKAGEVWAFRNLAAASTGFTITLKASNGDVIRTVYPSGGVGDITPLSNDPTTGAAWEGVSSIVTSWNALGANVASTSQQANALTFGGNTTAGTYGTISVNVAQMRRVGSSAEFTMRYRQTVAGSSGTGDLVIRIPSGLTINSTKVNITTDFTNASVVGHGLHENASTRRWVEAVAYSSTSVGLVVGDDVTAAGLTTPSFANTTFGASVTFSVPITEWTTTKG